MSKAIDALVQELRRITAENTDPRAILQQVAPLAGRMKDDRNWMKPEYYECGAEQGFGITVLHEEPDHSLLVEVIAWLPGRGVKPHDHQTWGVVVGLEGHETNVNWLRRDDGSKPGFADLHVGSEVVVGPGHTAVFMPDDIHSVRNDGDVTTVSLHIYGRSLAFTNRSEFDPEAKTVTPCPKRERKAA
jgi:predicted metal-dependent enzyme (double-stranded beta helix superfamily)